MPCPARETTERGYEICSSTFRSGLLLVTLVTTACSAPIAWIAEQEQHSARAPQAFEQCKNEELGFDPERQVLLGGKASAFWQWAQKELPNNFRLGHNGRLALMPNSSPGVAVHVSVRDGLVASLVIQSHSSSASTAHPLSRDAVRRFLHDSTGCTAYKLCQARANIDGIRFHGHTTCSSAQVPMKLVTPSIGHNIISVAVWMPSFSPAASPSSGRWNASPHL